MLYPKKMAVTKNNKNKRSNTVGQAKVRKMNGTYWREPEENEKCIYIDPSLPVWAQLPNRPGIRECLIATEAKEVGTLSSKSTAYHESAHAVFYELAGVGV